MNNITTTKALPDKPLLRIDEVAAFFDVTSRTVRNWYNCGELEGVNLPARGVRIFKESVLKYLKRPLLED